MKIAVTATGPTLDDQVETRFGRCAYFLIIDTDSLAFEAIENPNTALGGGAGIQSAQLLANNDVSTVLTGNCGPNAFQTFGAAGIQVVTGVSGPVRQAVEQFKSGDLAASSAANVQSHFGMGGGGRGMGMGQGRGMGMGQGRGMGMGQGRGMGMGQGRGMGQGQPAPPAPAASPKPADKKDEAAALREQAEALQQQMDQILSRLKQLEEDNK